MQSRARPRTINVGYLGVGVRIYIYASIHFSAGRIVPIFIVFFAHKLWNSFWHEDKSDNEYGTSTLLGSSQKESRRFQYSLRTAC